MKRKNGGNYLREKKKGKRPVENSFLPDEAFFENHANEEKTRNDEAKSIDN